MGAYLRGGGGLNREITLTKELQIYLWGKGKQLDNAWRVSSAALRWFKSFLTDRKQYVKIRQSKYRPLNVRHGVQQGSILWPLSFSIYTNDKTSLNSYVDDRKISLSFPIYDKLEGKAVLEDLKMSHLGACMYKLSPLKPGKDKIPSIQYTTAIKYNLRRFDDELPS